MTGPGRVMPARRRCCHRTRTPDTAASTDCTRTTYISCRYTSCCVGSSHSTDRDSRSRPNAQYAPTPWIASMDSHNNTVVPGSRKSTP